MAIFSKNLNKLELEGRNFLVGFPVPRCYVVLVLGIVFFIQVVIDHHCYDAMLLVR